MPEFTKENSPLSRWTFVMANFATQYNFGSMAIALIVMSSDLCTTDQAACNLGKQAGWVTGTSNATILIGAIVGQLGMGKLGDVVGRNTAFLATMTLATFGSILSASAPSGPPDKIYAGIIGCRFILGLGLGGVYPLSATKASEDSGSEDGNTVDSVAAAWAFFWQMPGVMGPYALAYFIALDDKLTVDQFWRLVLGFGAVPAGFAMVLLILEKIWLQNNREEAGPALSPDNVRVTSRRATADPNFANVINNNLQIKDGAQINQPHLALRQSSPPNSDDPDNNGGVEAGAAEVKDVVPPRASIGRPSQQVRNSRANTGTTLARTSISSLTDDTNAPVDERGKRVYSYDSPHRSSVLDNLREEYVQDPYLVNRFMVSGLTWLLFDIVVYGLGLFGPEIIYAISNDGSTNISSTKSLQHLTSGMLLVQSMALPSTVLGIYLIPHLTLKTMQTSGFALISIVCLIFGSLFNTLRKADPTALYALFVIVGFFMQFLVNVTTFVMPAAVFRKEVRASFNGISAAMGKCGAVVGAFAFPAIGESGSNGVIIIMILCCVAGIAGALVTRFYLIEGMMNDGDNMGQPIQYGRRTYGQSKSTRSTNTRTASRSASEMELSKPHNIIKEEMGAQRSNNGSTKLNPIHDV